MTIVRGSLVPDHYSSRLSLDKEEEQRLKRRTILGAEVLGAAPSYSECAFVAKRPLSWAWWVKGVSHVRKDSFLDRFNKEFSHEHIIFQQSGDNVGFGPQGLFSEDMRKHEYRLSSPCLDGDLMRQALNRVRPPKLYLFFFSNCQSFVAKVLAAYNDLVKSRKDLLEHAV